MHLSLICMTVRLGWTDCHTFVSYLYCKAWVDWLSYICLLFGDDSKVCVDWLPYVFTCSFLHVAFSPAALNRARCIVNVETFFLMMRFIYLVEEIKWMLISSRHSFIRSKVEYDSPHLRCVWIAYHHYYLERARLGPFREYNNCTAQFVIPPGASISCSFLWCVFTKRSRDHKSPLNSSHDFFYSSNG